VSAQAPAWRAIEPGSIADVVRLYCATPVRAVLENLLALEAEIRTSARPDLDHAIAHVRLEWWQGEIERTLKGTAAHPLTRALCTALAPRSPDLQPLLLSARLEVAGLSGADARSWQSFYEGSLGTVFVILGQTLGSAVAAETLRTLGGAVQQLSTERTPSPRLLAALEALTPALQTEVCPLLVWTALVGWRTARGIEVADEAAPSGWWAGASQQWIAWSAARAAQAGRFRWRWQWPAPAAPSGNPEVSQRENIDE
jgi:hypothetical protein